MWKSVPLNQICDLQNGYAFKSKDYIEFSNTMSCRMSNIRPGGKFDIDYNPRYLPDNFKDKYPQYVLNDSDVVIAMTDLAGLPKILGVPTVINTENRTILLNQRVGKLLIIDPELVYFGYLKFALSEPRIRKYYQKFAGGGLQINLGKEDLLSVEIPLPPLPVQKQIAAVLEKADTLRQQCQQMEQELNALAQSVFLDMFGDPVANPNGWKKKQVKDLVKDFQGGKSLAASEDAEGSGVNRVLKISAVTLGEFKPEESKPLPNDYNPPLEHFVRVNDLLFSRANTTELVGATSLVFKTPKNVLLPDKLWRFVWHDSTSISQIFYWQLFSNKAIRVELGKISSGSGGSMKNISKGKLNELEVLCPPFELQQKFELIYLEIRSQQQLALSKLAALNDTFNSLMQRAFKGELELKGVA
ncbi:MAG: type I restriction enzyme S subunit [Oleiphilaceae bacterium]|jgi:type I restriction enzyme S subunit